MTKEQVKKVLEGEKNPTQAAEKEKKQRVVMVSTTNLLIDDCAYRLVTNYREGFDSDRLSDRYSEVLNRYEYIVGDMGFEQLRLRGFFSDDHVNMPAEQRISNLEDYLYEYCNFGCPYFVLERIGEHPIKESKQRPKRSNQRQNRQSGKKPAHINEKRQANDTGSRDKKIANRQRPVVKKRQDKPSEAKVAQKSPIKKSNEPAISKENAGQQVPVKKERGFTIRQKNN